MHEAYEVVREDIENQSVSAEAASSADWPVKLLSSADLSHLAQSLPRPMVFTNGVFDVLHRGHVMCLARARALGRSLVVGLNGDRSARRLEKGPGRPVNPALDRAWVLAGLAAVDAIAVFDEDKPLRLMSRLRPDIYVKGGDYDIATLEEATLVAGWGGATRIIDRLPGYSSTAVIDRMAGVERSPYAVGAAR